MPSKTIKRGQFLVVRGRSSQGLTSRGRIMQSPLDQIVYFKSPNKYLGIELLHISGPMKGVRIHFNIALARKAKIMNVCLCSAYSYPHRKGKGKCQN